VEVIEGLNEGEQIVVSGQVNLTEGSAVNIIQVKNYQFAVADSDKKY